MASEEAWHYYEGDALELSCHRCELRSVERIVLGPVAAGVAPVHVVPANCWQAARPLGAYTLVGCTVGPGFDFADFEMLKGRSAERDLIAQRHPHLATLI